MRFAVETLGNATLQFFADGKPLLVTDPWLEGTCYFGSWALDHPLTPLQKQNVFDSPYVWISHGHPDHLHNDSLALIPRDKTVLVPGHYTREIADFIESQGFTVRVLPYRQWVRLTPDAEVLCLDNDNQDAVLVVRIGGALVVNLNDSPLSGEAGFLRRLIRSHPNDRTYLMALCAIDADMLNIVDGDGRRMVGPPDERKPGMIWRTARIAENLGVKHFCCSSSQHIYVRADSVWANPYRVTWDDMRRWWNRPSVALLEPFVTVDLETGAFTRNHPSQTSDTSQITDRTGDDDWDDPLSEGEWGEIAAFVARFKTLGRCVDRVAFTVAGETREFAVSARAQENHPRAKRRIRFRAPRQSLMETVRAGYFDDLLIGNFMQTELTGTALYPDFTPTVAKLGGNAKVYTAAEVMAYRWHYFKRNPVGYSLWRLERLFDDRLVPRLREASETLGVKRPLKYIYRSLLGDPVR